MTQLNDPIYYRRRGEHAHSMAQTSVSEEIAIFYRQMAESYEQLAFSCVNAGGQRQSNLTTETVHQFATDS